MADSTASILQSASATLLDDLLGDAAAPLDAAVEASAHRTVVFTDIVRSTQLIDHSGDAAWLRVVQAHHALAWELGRLLGAEHVKSTGDGVFAVMGDAQSAMAFGAAMAEGMRRAADLGRCPAVELKVGIAAGPVHRMFGDYHGRTMHLAARLCGEAGADGMLISASCADSLPGPASMLGRQRPTYLRGFGDPEPAHLVRLGTAASSDAR